MAMKINITDKRSHVIDNPVLKLGDVVKIFNCYYIVISVPGFRCTLANMNNGFQTYRDNFEEGTRLHAYLSAYGLMNEDVEYIPSDKVSIQVELRD